MAAVGSPMPLRHQAKLFKRLSGRCARSFRQRFCEAHGLLDDLEVQGVLLGQLKSLLPGPENS